MENLKILDAADLCGRPARNGQSAVDGLLPITRQTLWRWVRSGKFPAPLRLGESRVGWRESDVSRWLATRPPEIYARSTEA